jgi:hypothetical protein
MKSSIKWPSPRVRKVVLRRRSFLAVFVSKLRADKSGLYLGASLDTVSVRVDPPALQSFVWGYNDAFGKYAQMLRGQARDAFSHTSLCSYLPARRTISLVLVCPGLAR